MTSLAELRKLAKKVGWTIRVHKGTLHKYTMHNEDGEQVYWARTVEFLEKTIRLEMYSWKSHGCSGKTTMVATPRKR